jgi:Ca2+/Na+ antiporter
MEKLRTNLFFLACLLLVSGMLLIDLARVLPSIYMILMVLIGISYWVKPTTNIEKSNPSPFISLATTFLILLPSYFYSTDTHYLFERWQIAIPFLVLPLAFVKIPRLSDKKHAFIYAFYFLSIL